MNGRKLACALLSLGLILSLVACGGKPEPTPEAPQTVTGTGEGTGYAGAIKVEITLSADKSTIEDVKVIEQSETEAIGGKAIEQLTAAVKENQSVNLDAVSGATLASEGFLTAVKAAIENAGGDPASFGTAVENPASTPGTPEAAAFAAPYIRVAGYAMEGDFPLAVWVDFDPETDKVLGVTLTGYGNPAIVNAFGDTLEAMMAAKADFVGKAAEDLAGGGDTLASAVAQAAQSYLDTKDRFIIRPYQSMMTERYMANNPYLTDSSLKGEVTVETEIVAQYPADAITLVTEDVLYKEKVTYPAGMSVAAVNESLTINSGVIYANKPGVAVIAYRFGDMVLYDALDIYENFTTDLSGADAYGKLIGVIDESEDAVTYRVLGDKAMNFPGGTCGSTVVDVTIDKKTDTLSKVYVAEHSDSTYLANAWEYGGGFANVGELIYHIDTFTAKFEGLDAKTSVTPYELTTKESTGGTVVDGGIDMVVSGATRTPNAIVRAVNAAIEAYAG